MDQVARNSGQHLHGEHSSFELVALSLTEDAADVHEPVQRPSTASMVSGSVTHLIAAGGGCAQGPRPQLLVLGSCRGSHV